jgi:hypothetical protein
VWWILPENYPLFYTVYSILSLNYHVRMLNLISAPILDMWMSEKTIIRHSFFENNIISLMFLLDYLLMDTITSVAFHLQFTLKYNVIHFFYSQVHISFKMFLLSWTISSKACLMLLSKTVTVYILHFHWICTSEHLRYSVESGHSSTHTCCAHSMW